MGLSIVSGQITKISGSNIVSTCMCGGLEVLAEAGGGGSAGRGLFGGLDEPPRSQTERQEVQSPRAR